MASLLTPGAFGGAEAGPPSILAPSQKAQPPSILNQGPPSILAPAPDKPKSAQKKKKPQKAKQPDPERTTVPVGDAVAPEPAMARKDKKEKQQKKKKPAPKKEPKASPKSEEQKEAAGPSSPPHYAFSAFQISPEPSSLPKPSFSFGKKKT